MSDHTEEIRVEKQLGGRIRLTDGEICVMGANYALICDMYNLLIKQGVELQALRQEVTRLTKSLAAADAYFPAAALEVVNLRQENARLKGTLQAIVRWCDGNSSTAEIAHQAEEIARAALSSSPAQRESDHAGL